MTVVWTHVGLAGLWGGLLAVERRAFLQAMFSRPLVAATGMGLLLGDLPSGLFVGMLLELFYLGGASLGAALPDNDTLAATCCAAASAEMAQGAGAGSTPAIWSLAIIVFAGTGRLGLMLDRWLERYSTRLAGRAQRSAESGDLDRAMRQNLWGVWPHFVVFGLATAVCAALGDLLAPWETRLPLGAVRGLAWAYPAMASVAAAIAAKGARAKHGLLYAAMAAIAVSFFTGFLMLRGLSR